jgi:hypothetical protein
MNFVIEKVPHKVAKHWVETWHYSKRMPTGKNINFGVFCDGELYAVIVYGIGVNPYQAKYLGVDNVIEIKRMCRSEPPNPNYPLSKFISLTTRLVVKEFPCQCVVAFADPEQGHEGTVYKASNFKLHGKTNAEVHLIDAHGVMRHRRYAFRHARRNNIPLEESRQILGVTRIKTQPKYRWVRMLKGRSNVAV